jgi:hypothetical protein
LAPSREIPILFILSSCPIPLSVPDFLSSRLTLLLRGCAPSRELDSARTCAALVLFGFFLTS